MARPNTASIDISNAQVYGDSPEDWRKERLVEYVRRIVSALEDRLASDAVPVVLVADAETGGHFQKFISLGSLLVGVVEANPEAMDETALHEAAFAIMQPRLDTDRQGAIERFAALHGGGDARAANSLEDVVRAAYQGRIDTLLLAEGEAAPGRYDEDIDVVATGPEDTVTSEDLLDAAAVRTLRHCGAVFVVPREELPGDAAAAAVLRY